MAPRSCTLELKRYLEDGDKKALARVVSGLLPIVSTRTSRMVMRRPFYGRDAKQEVPDLVQEVLVALLDNNARLLRAWDEARGLSLENFVGLLCEREIASILRSGRRSPHRTPEEDINDYDQLPDLAPSLDTKLMSHELVILVLDEARTSLSPLGLEMLERLIIAQEAPEQIATEMQMNIDAVYAWRSRITKLLRNIAARTEPPSSTTLKATSTIPKEQP